MPMLFRLDKEGGFTVADMQTGVTAYAYPTSRNAVRADQAGTMAPVKVAEAMIAEEARRRVYDPAWTSDLDKDNRERLAAGVEDGSTVTRQSGERFTHERISAEGEAAAVQTIYPGYDPNAPGSDLTAQRVTGEAERSAPVSTSFHGYIITGDERHGRIVGPNSWDDIESPVTLYGQNDRILLCSEDGDPRSSFPAGTTMREIAAFLTGYEGRTDAAHGGLANLTNREQAMFDAGREIGPDQWRGREIDHIIDRHMRGVVEAAREREAAEPVASAPEMTAEGVNIMFDVQDRLRAERISAEGEAAAVQTIYPGYDPNAPGSDLTARRVTGEENGIPDYELQDTIRATRAAHGGEITYQGDGKEFDAFEVSQVIEWHTNDGQSSICEPLGAGPYATIDEARRQSDYKSDFWTVYGHMPQEGVDALGDFPTENAARDYLAELTGDRGADKRPFADNEVTLKEYRDRADAERRAEEQAAQLEADGPPQETAATILYRFDTAGEFIVGNTVTREIGCADSRSRIAHEARNDPEGRAHEMAAMLDDNGSFCINSQSEDRRAWANEQAVFWEVLEAGHETGMTKELASYVEADLEPNSAAPPELEMDEEEELLQLSDPDADVARLDAEADHENAERYAAIFNEEGKPSPSITTWQAARAIAEENGFSLGVAEPQLDPNCHSYTLTDQPGRPGFHTPVTFDVQSPQAAYDTLRYALSLWSGKDIAANEPGLPQIGATVTREDDEPRRRATDRERAGPTSRIEKDMIQGLGRKIEREQREIYHTEGMDKQEKSDALDANLACNIEAWDRPAVTAARALDAGRVLQAAPLLQQMRDSLPKDKRDAANKLCAALDARRANSNANSDDYAVSG